MACRCERSRKVNSPRMANPKTNRRLFRCGCVLALVLATLPATALSPVTVVNGPPADVSVRRLESQHDFRIVPPAPEPGYIPGRIVVEIKKEAPGYFSATVAGTTLADGALAYQVFLDPALAGAYSLYVWDRESEPWRLLYSGTVATVPETPEDWNSTPEALIAEFQTDFQMWRFAAEEPDDSVSTIERKASLRSGHEQLLRKYTRPGSNRMPLPLDGEWGNGHFCRPGITASDQPVPVAVYETDGKLDPERILWRRADGDRAAMRTECPGLVSTSTYDYELVRNQGRWYLEQVYRVGPGTRIPEL